MGELKDAANFRGFVEKQIARGRHIGRRQNPVRFVDDPLTADVPAEGAGRGQATRGREG